MPGASKGLVLILRVISWKQNHDGTVPYKKRMNCGQFLNKTCSNWNSHHIYHIGRKRIEKKHCFKLFLKCWRSEKDHGHGFGWKVTIVSGRKHRGNSGLRHRRLFMRIQHPDVYISAFCFAAQVATAPNVGINPALDIAVVSRIVTSWIFDSPLSSVSGSIM